MPVIYRVVIRSLYEFEVRMTRTDPLFDVEAVLATPEIRITPTAHEIFSLVTQSARQCVEGTKRFVRWRRGSCIEVTPIKQQDEEPFLYTYFNDVGRLPRVLELLLQIQENILGIIRNLWTYLRKYVLIKVTTNMTCGVQVKFKIKFIKLFLQVSLV